MKELTIRGLEPEVQRLVQKHRAEVRDVQDAHREDLRRQNAELTQRHEAGPPPAARSTHSHVHSTVSIRDIVSSLTNRPTPPKPAYRQSHRVP